MEYSKHSLERGSQEDKRVARKVAKADITLIVGFGFLAGSLGAGFFISLLFLGFISLLVCIVLNLTGVLTMRWLLVLLAAFGAGFFYYHLFLNFNHARIHMPFNERVSFSGFVQREPKLFQSSQIITLNLASPLRGMVEVLERRFPEVRYGDVLELEGAIQEPMSLADNPTSSFPKIFTIVHNQGFWPKEKLLDFKYAFVLQLGKFFPSESAALLSGITVGWQADFSKEFKNEMAQSGTTHLVALSGYNIAILVLFVAAVWGRFFSQKATFYLTIIIIVLFVMMVGAEASVVRAAIMGFLLLLARYAGREYSFLHIFVFAAAIMTLIDPTLPSVNIGFQLSFLSLAGIVYIKPFLDARLNKLRSPGFLGWRENMTTTMAAQLAVAPVLLATFGQFSLLAVIANILILEFVPLITLLGFSLGILSMVFSPAALFLAIPLQLLLGYSVAVIKVFSHIQIPVHSSYPVFFLIAAYYIVLVVFVIQKESSASSRIV